MAPSDHRRVLDELVAALRRREDELVDVMHARFLAEAPEFAATDDPEVLAAMRRSTTTNLRAALDGVATDDGPLPFGPPADAIAEARTAARAGMPLSDGLRTYRIGQETVIDAAIEVLDGMGDLDAATRSAVLRRCMQHSFAYVDAVVPFVTDAYTDERDRRMRGREQRRVLLVRELLDGADVDAGDLGYDLRATHRAAVGRGPGADALLAALAASLGAPLLALSVGPATTWAWLATAVDDRELRAATGPAPRDAGVAFGRVARGIDGFRAGHREARAAHRIGVATDDAVVFFADVALESLLLADEAAARAFVTAELAPLDAGRDGAKLRATIRAYLAAGANASAAAAHLGVGDRTIAYRLNVAEQLLGRTVRERQTELAAAIRLERVLGG